MELYSKPAASRIHSSMFSMTVGPSMLSMKPGSLQAVRSGIVEELQMLQRLTPAF